jgi:predicted NUDIX family NTP pyrophosphohydrolase
LLRQKSGQSLSCVSIEWPPHSGRQMEIPEIDRAEFFDLVTAKKKIKAGQEKLIAEFETIDLL